jgi:NTE family protein
LFLGGAVNWSTGELHYFRNVEMSDEIGPLVLMASAAIPGLLPQVRVNGVPYGDGGVVENTPLSSAIASGAEVLHVITTAPAVSFVPIHEISNTVDALYRMLLIREYATLDEDIDRARAINYLLKKTTEAAYDWDPQEIRNTPDLADVADRVYRRLRAAVRYREVTIHVYRPYESLGGLLALMNFDRRYVKEMIEKGYTDTIYHNCESNGCVLPN